MRPSIQAKRIGTPWWLRWGAQNLTQELRQIVVMLVVFLFFYMAGRESVGAWLKWRGYTISQVADLTRENELIYQLMGWVAGLYAGWNLRGLKGFLNVFKKYFSQRPWVRVIDRGANSFLKGHTFTCVIAAISSLAGFQKFDYPSTPWYWLIIDLGPGILSLSLWIALFEIFRELIWDYFTVEQRKNFSNWVVLWALEVFVYFRLFCSPTQVSDWAWGLSMAFSMTLVSFTAFYIDRIKTENTLWNLQNRILIKSGFMVGMVHVFNQALAGHKKDSLLLSQLGSVGELTGSLANQGLVGQVLFVVFVSLSGLFLAWRYVRTIQKQHNPHL